MAHSLQIFVADDEYTGGSVSAEAKTQRWRKALDLPPLGASPLDDPNLRSERLSGAQKSAASAAAVAAETLEPPTWWETAPPSYVPEAQREVSAVLVCLLCLRDVKESRSGEWFWQTGG